MNKNDVTVNYAFQEYIPEKELNEIGIKEVSRILTYEEPRWTLKNTASALKIIKESDSSLYETILSYIKEQHLPSENVLYLDFGKSLRYDHEYMGDFSKETLSDKLDNRFIVRYSHDNDEGNLIDGGDEIIINDKELVSLFNGMIEGHVKENIQKYDEYKTQREAAQKNKEIEKGYTNFLDRKSLLADSKIVTDEMLNVLYELSEEDVNFDSLEKFTEKKYRELNTEERTELIKKLSNADYKLYKNCYISTSKLLYEKPETLVKEIKALNVLNDLGYTVYLLPFGYARNNQEFLQKSADSMLKSQFLEMKTILSTSKNAGQSAFKDSRKQSNNVILSFTEDITPHKAMQSIWNYINGAKKNLIKNNESYDFSGELFLHFEKDNKTVLYEISKEGEFIQKDVHAFGLKKTLTLNESQVVELFSDKTHPLPKFTIQSNPNSVNEQMKENLKNNLSEQIWLWKDYDDLSGHLVAPDGKSYFSYDWTTKEYKVTPDSVWDSFLDADPTRDTSLTAFKEYAQKFVKENIVKDRDIKIIFEREYIDTEKLLEEEEKRMAKSETLADKYNRMEKIFEVKMSHLGSGNGETFNELCKWVEEEFPEKNSEAVLLEATSRMLEEMFDFDEFNYQNYDDVYGFGDGAQWRFDLSESAAKKLLSGEILNYYEAQNYIWEKTKKEFAELKNNPQYKDEIEITDRINSAFRIADYLYPEFTKEIDKEKNLLPDEWPQYSKEEKKNVINNAFEHLYAAFKENRVILDVYDEDRLIIVDKSIPLKDFETLIKGRDAVNFGKESLTFTRLNAEQLQTGIKNGWGLKEILTGYDVFQDRFNESGQMLAELEAEKEFVPSEYVLSKLKEKGIEVVTEKEEFERILQRESHLQKMAGSLSFEEQKRYFTFDEDDSQKFHAQIDEWQKDNINIAKLVTVGKIPPVMKILNIDDNPIEIQYSTLNKIVRDNPLYPNDEQGHKLSIDDIYAIPSQLADPVMVFKSRTRSDSFVFFTERKDRENRSILIPLAVNKKKGRIIINEITSMYGRNNEIDFVKSNIDENNLIYADKKRSLDWERSSQVQFLTQRFSNPSFELSILTKERLVNFLSSNSRKNNVQNMVSNGTTYGFTHEGKIYLNPDVLSAEVAMHEYTHLWDNLTRKDNTELWSKGLQIFKGTSLWNEVVNDENYADIKDDENLVLSECHARITGKVAEAVLNRIAEQDGTEKQAEMIDWDKETINFIFENYRDVFAKNGFETVAEFTSATMKELFSPVEQQKRDISINSSAYERMMKDAFTDRIRQGIFSRDFDAKKIYESMVNDTFKEFNSIGTFTAGKCDYNLCITKGGLPEQPWIDISPVRTIGGSDINGTVSLALSDIKDITTSQPLEEQIKDTIINKIDELGDYPVDREMTIMTTLGKNWDEEKQYKMQQERNNDFAHPNAEDLDYASPKDIKEYCKLNSEIELTDEQVREIHNFYDNNDQFALYVSPAGNLYVRDEYDGNLISADSELLKAGNHLRTLEGKERLEYLLKNTSNDEPEWSKGLLNQTSNDSDERLRIVSDVLSDSFATLDRHDGFWRLLLDYGADPTRAIRIAAEDANLGDNLNWLLNNVPESHLNQIFSDNGYADTVFDIAQKSVEHDMDSWHGGQDIGFEGFKRIARLCEREADADRYYGELLEKAFEYPVEPKIVQLLDTPELLAEKMNNSKVHPNEPSISRDQASFILDYCNYENIKFYVAKDGGIYSLDVSEDYNGEGMAESNFGIVANGIEYARKAKDLNYSCYSTATFNTVSELWQKERQFVNPSVENINNAKEKILHNLKTGLLDTAIENNIKEYLRREYAETYPSSGKFEVTVENQSYPIDKDGLDYIANSDEWGSVEDRLNDVIDRRFEEEIEQKENDILSDVKEYIAQETNGRLILKDAELREVLFSEELVQIYAPKQEFLANQPEEVKAALIEAGIARSELYNNVESIPVSEDARNAMLSASYAGQGGITQKAFADNGIEIDLSTANALENCFSQIEAMTKYTSDGHDLFHSGNGVATISEHTIEYSEKDKAWFVHEKNWLALSAIEGNEAEPEDYMEKASRVGDRNWALSCKELVKYVYQEIKEDGEMEKKFPDTFKKLEKLNEYLEAERIKENGVQRRKEDYFANIKVSTENFRDVFNEIIKLPKFKDKPLKAANWCFSKVPKENKAEVVQWFSNLGCKTKKDTDKLFNKWNRENNPKLNVNKSKNNDKDDWSISD